MPNGKGGCLFLVGEQFREASFMDRQSDTSPSVPDEVLRASY